jgi:hypothetical protein
MKWIVPCFNLDLEGRLTLEFKTKAIKYCLQNKLRQDWLPLSF